MGSSYRRPRAGFSPRVLVAVVLGSSTVSCGESVTNPVEAPVPASIVAVAGDQQQGVVGEILLQRPTVRVVDRVGSPVSAVQVDWEVVAGGGEVHPVDGPTSLDGLHSADWRLGPEAGEQGLVARVGDLAAITFTAAAEPGPLFLIQVWPPNLILVLEEGRDEGRVEATPLDAFGNPTPDVIEWIVPDNTVAVVDQSGVVRAVGNGYSSVQAHVGSMVGGASLTVENPVPYLLEMTPASVVAGTPGVTVSLIGAGFVERSVVLWNGAWRPRTFVDASRIDVHVSAEDLAAPGTATVRVSSSTPGGGSTTSLTFVIGS